VATPRPGWITRVTARWERPPPTLRSWANGARRAFRTSIGRCWDGGHPGAVQARMAHLAAFAAPGKKGLVFCRRDAQRFRRASWYTAWGWVMKALDIEGMKPHDLRHSGNTLATMTGDSTNGADGQVRPVDLAGGADLSARRPGPRPRDRRRPRRHDRCQAQATPGGGPTPIA